MQINALLNACDECKNNSEKIYTIGFRKGTLTLCIDCMVKLSNSLVETLEPDIIPEDEAEIIQAKSSPRPKLVRFKVYPCRYCKECRPFTKLGMEQIDVHEVTDHPDQYRPISKPQMREASWRTRKITSS